MAPRDLSHYYVHCKQFETILRRLTSSPPFDRFFPDPRLATPFLLKHCKPPIETAAFSSLPSLSPVTSISIIEIFNGHLGIPLDILPHILRVYCGVDVCEPDDEVDYRPEFMRLAKDWINETEDKTRRQYEERYIKALTDFVPMLRPMLLRPIFEHSTSRKENRALELAKAELYAEAIEIFRELCTAEPTRLRHHFNLAFCLSANSEIEQALTVIQHALSLRLEDKSCQKTLNSPKDRHELGAAWYMAAQLEWQQGNYARAADCLDLLTRSVKHTLTFDRELRILARLASGMAIQTPDLEGISGFSDGPSIHLNICAAVSLRRTGNLDLLRKLRDSAKATPTQELLRVWSQTGLPAPSIETLAHRLAHNSDKSNVITGGQAEEIPQNPRESLPELPEIPAAERPISGSNRFAHRSEDILKAKVTPAMRGALDRLTTLNGKRTQILETLHLLLDRFDADGLNRWRTVAEESADVEDDLLGAFEECKREASFDLDGFTQLGECLVELRRRPPDYYSDIKQQKLSISNATGTAEILHTLNRFGSRSEAFALACRERDEAVQALVDEVKGGISSLPEDSWTAEQLSLLPEPNQPVRIEEIRWLRTLRSAVNDRIQQQREEAERREKICLLQDLTAFAKQLGQGRLEKQVERTNSLVERFDGFDLVEHAHIAAAAWTKIVPAMRNHDVHKRCVQCFIDALRLLSAENQDGAAIENVLEETIDAGWNAREFSDLAAEIDPGRLFRVVRQNEGNPDFKIFIQTVGPHLLRNLALPPKDALRLIAELSTDDWRQHPQLLAKSVKLLLETETYGMALVVWSALFQQDEALAVSVEPDAPLLYFVIADRHAMARSQDMIPLLNDVFNDKYIHQRYRQSFGFGLALATAACWYAAQLDAPHWCASAKTFLSPLHEVYPQICQLLTSCLECPSKLSQIAKAAHFVDGNEVAEPYATELSRATHQIKVECASAWLREKLARICQTQK